MSPIDDSSAMSLVPPADRVPQEYVDLAHKLGDVSGAIATSLHRTKVGIDVKEDFSPVTVADRSAEEAMRRMIHETFDDHAVFGEESGLSTSKHSYEQRGQDEPLPSEPTWKWVLDPIDGTKSFITGGPLFGNLISLVHKSHGPVLGMVNMPCLGERWVGGMGIPTTMNGERVSVRQCTSVSKAVLYAPNPKYNSEHHHRAFDSVVESVSYCVYGGDCYPYALLATGFVDVVLESNLKPWDYFALVPVIENAGGVITDWKGDALTEQSEGLVVACGSKDIHREMLDMLNQ